MGRANGFEAEAKWFEAVPGVRVSVAQIEPEPEAGEPPVHVESRLADARQLAAGEAAVFGGVFSSTILWMLGGRPRRPSGAATRGRTA